MVIGLMQASLASAPCELVMSILLGFCTMQSSHLTGDSGPNDPPTTKVILDSGLSGQHYPAAFMRVLAKCRVDADALIGSSGKHQN